MRTIGFVVSSKENERRRALLPEHLQSVRHRSSLVFESGYGHHFGIQDDEYRALGCAVASRESVHQCEVVCNPKTPEPSERGLYATGQTLFGWVHAVQGRAIVDFLLERRMTAVAWEDMFDRGRHVFWRNNEIAGEAAILHAVPFLGRLPGGLRAALIGRGNCARGAFRALAQLGVEVVAFDRHTSGHLRSDLPSFDVVVNAVQWDVFCRDHLVYAEDLKRMKRGSMIIDISCDEGMGIETTRATPISEPVYEVDGIIHYAVDHTPALFWRTATHSIGAALAPFVDRVVTGEIDDCLRGATIIESGRIIDDRIARFQNRGVPAA